MTDPKDELRARFDEQAKEETSTRSSDSSDSNSTASKPDSREHADGTGNSQNTGNTPNTQNTSDANNMDVGNNADGVDTGTKPGPEKETTATRHRRQVPMYLSDQKATDLNKLYERLDGRSKVAGEGGIEKHADFMEALAEFAIENEDELADRLDIT